MAAAPESRRIAVGIDLGTTNSALAWADYSPGLAQIRPAVLPVRQLVALGEIQARQMLPSAIYLSADGEFSADSTRLPWQSPEFYGPIVGELARQLGPRVPTRFVISAKSWLALFRVSVPLIVAQPGLFPADNFTPPAGPVAVVTFSENVLPLPRLIVFPAAASLMADCTVR